MWSSEKFLDSKADALADQISHKLAVELTTSALPETVCNAISDFAGAAIRR